MWTTDQALALCRKIENIAPAFGCHVALTGGLLYKDGPRKDCDILFYRIRQWKKVNVVGLFTALERIGISTKHQPDEVWGWCVKAKYLDESIDCFFPEEIAGGDYPTEEKE